MIVAVPTVPPVLARVSKTVPPELLQIRTTVANPTVLAVVKAI